MNKFEFMRNLEIYRSNKPKDVLQHDSYDIPKQETHKIQSEYSKAPKVYKDQISLYEEYNSDTIEHGCGKSFYGNKDKAILVIKEWDGDSDIEGMPDDIKVKIFKTFGDDAFDKIDKETLLDYVKNLKY